MTTLALSQRVSLYLNEARYEFLNVWRTPAFSLPSLAFPVIFYIFFGLVFNMGGRSDNQAMYLMGTYGTFGIMGPALFGFGAGLATDRDQGWLLLKQASPMPIAAYFFAKVMMSMLFALIILVTMFALAAFAGGVVLAWHQWLLLVAMLVVGTLPFCAIGLCIGCWAKAGPAVAIVNLVYLPMALLSGLWIPIMVFPESLQLTALIYPSYHLSQLALGVLDMDQGGQPWLHLLVLMVQTALFLVIAASGFRRLKK